MNKTELREMIKEVLSRREMYDLEDKYPKAKELKIKVIALIRKESRKLNDNELYAFSQILDQWNNSLI